jgi:endonuclease YncB( thermonuclease family)
LDIINLLLVAHDSFDDESSSRSRSTWTPDPEPLSQEQIQAGYEAQVRAEKEERQRLQAERAAALKGQRDVAEDQRRQEAIRAAQSRAAAQKQKARFTQPAPDKKAEPLEKPFTGKCVGVSDGDTISVMRGCCAAKVRLTAVDSPEKAQAFGEKAKQFTRNFAFGKTVTVYPTGTDQYQRTPINTNAHRSIPTHSGLGLCRQRKPQL